MVALTAILAMSLNCAVLIGLYLMAIKDLGFDKATGIFAGCSLFAGAVVTIGMMFKYLV